MTRQGFMDRVLLSLTRLTAEEREIVRQELEEHIEDRMEVMLEMGWKPELAEERCLEAMGDPVEIGREMAKQYRGRGWLWLGRAAVLLTVVLCIQALLGVGILFNAWDSLEARVNPQWAPGWTGRRARGKWICGCPWGTTCCGCSGCPWANGRNGEWRRSPCAPMTAGPSAS